MRQRIATAGVSPMQQMMATATLCVVTCAVAASLLNSVAASVAFAGLMCVVSCAAVQSFSAEKGAFGISSIIEIIRIMCGSAIFFLFRRFTRLLGVRNAS